MTPWRPAVRHCKCPIRGRGRDSFIGATALVHRLVLVTRNVEDFAAMGLEILNPWDQS